MRMIVGLDAPTSGTATVNGRHYRELAAPLREVGTMLEARAIHTGRSAYNHLLAMAQTHGIPRAARRRGDRARRPAERGAQARRRASRSAWASAWGSPRRCSAIRATLILDEPANGLDPEGILWIRNLLKGLAAEGRTVFLSSHLMSEIALTAEHVIVIGRGRLIADTSVEEVVAQASTRRARCCVRTPQRAERCATRSSAPGVVDRAAERGAARGPRPDRRADRRDRAASAAIVLDELTPRQASLEEAFMALTGDAVEYHARRPTRAERGRMSRPHERRRRRRRARSRA